MNPFADAPKEWTVGRVGMYCDVQLGKMLQNDPVSENDQLKPYLRAINVAKDRLDLSHQFSMWIRPQELDRFRLKKGDILVSEGGDSGRTVIFDSDQEYYFQNAINRLRPDSSERVDPRFLYYWFTYLKLSGYVDLICNVATISHFTAEKVKASPLIIPPLGIQRQIAQFLDSKIEKINQLIDKKLELWDRLAEKRQVLITQAVTKGSIGLYTEASGIVGFNDSAHIDGSWEKWKLAHAYENRHNRAIERVGEMNPFADAPKEWTVGRVGMYCDVQLGKMLQNDPVSENDQLKPYLRAINVAKDRLDLSHQFSMWIRPQELDRFRLKKGDILVSEGGDSGRTVIFDSDQEYYFQNAINRLRPDSSERVDPRFLYYWFTYLKLSGYVDLICNVATISHFTAEKVKASPLIIPPLGIQQQIVKFLDDELAKIDVLARKINEAIALLEEYRSALITSSVTGQISKLLRNDAG